jgi:putative CocE/NonD family hydrolase
MKNFIFVVAFTTAVVLCTSGGFGQNQQQQSGQGGKQPPAAPSRQSSEQQSNAQTAEQATQRSVQNATSERYPDFPSEMPQKFTPTNYGYDYERRDVMIPMRDGVKLHTVILVPKGAKNAPILMTRTPYDATALTSHEYSTHLAPALEGYDNATDVIVEGGYIRVVQDIRGKYGSEGDYVMTRPLHGPLNPTPVDESTDTYDSIDWLVKNVPESNGKVGILGISYDGFLPLMALVNPHPALKVDVPMNPMVDGWRGDDWFHYGAFRQMGSLDYIYEQEATRKNDEHWPVSAYDEYDVYMDAGTAGNLARERGMEQLGFWRKIVEHPTYDDWWQQQAMDKVLAAQPLKVPTMLVHSLWDQEDIYGAPAVYKAIKPKDTNNDMVWMVMGPWHHGGEIGDGSNMDAIRFDSDTGKYFRENILAPFLAHYLKDAPEPNLPTVMAFETGTNHWDRLPTWPSCGQGCTIKPTPLYLNSGLKVSFDAPQAGGSEYEEYISDPAKPIPFHGRPYRNDEWKNWLVSDQRGPSGRPDVLSYVSDVLIEPVRIAGTPRVNLVASTSGTDSDWVVKLIDLYPEEVAAEPELGGYQLMISADVFRGRYRENLAVAKPIEPNKPLLYKFDLPNANHVFLPGHSIMVQVQSSWFPLYDRNPQEFVPSIFFAKPSDFQKATQRIYHAPNEATYIELPLVAK